MHRRIGSLRPSDSRVELRLHARPLRLPNPTLRYCAEHAEEDVLLQDTFERMRDARDGVDEDDDDGDDDSIASSVPDSDEEEDDDPNARGADMSSMLNKMVLSIDPMQALPDFDRPDLE